MYVSLCICMCGYIVESQCLQAVFLSFSINIFHSSVFCMHFSVFSYKETRSIHEIPPVYNLQSYYFNVQSEGVHFQYFSVKKILADPYTWRYWPGLCINGCGSNSLTNYLSFSLSHMYTHTTMYKGQYYISKREQKCYSREVYISSACKLCRI